MRKFKTLTKVIAIVLSIVLLAGAVAAGLLTAAKKSNADTTYTIDEALNDPSTSNIEDSFSLISGDTGKILADKTVLYLTDENGAYAAYDEDQFSVTLSALSQGLNRLVEEDVTMTRHSDVVFVLDISGSMQEYSMPNDSTVSRLQAACNALNQCINVLLAKDPQTRFGIVVYNNAARREGTTHYDYYYSGYTVADDTGLYLPLDYYSLKYPGDTQYVVYNKTRIEGGSVVVPDYPITDEVTVNDGQTHWVYPEDEVDSLIEDKTKMRVSITSDGKYAFYPANQTASVLSGTLEDQKYVYCDTLKVAIMRQGNVYDIYNDVEATATRVPKKGSKTVSNIASGTDSTPSSSSKTTISVNGRNFYAYSVRTTSTGFFSTNTTYEIKVYSTASSSSTIASLSSDNQSATWTDSATGVTYKFTRTGNQAMTIAYEALTSTTLSGIEDTRTALTFDNGKTFYIDRTGSGSNLNFNVYTTQTGTTAACTLSATQEGASATTVQEGVTYTFTRESDTSVVGSYMGTTEGNASDVLTAKTTVTFNGQTFYFDRSEYDGAARLNVYTQNSTGATPVLSLTAADNATGTYTMGGIEYTFTATDKNTLTYSYQVSGDTATIPEIRKAVTINGQTFYVERAGTSGNYQFRIYNSMTATSQEGTLSATTANATTTVTRNRVTYTFKRTANDALTVSCSAGDVTSDKVTIDDDSTRTAVTVDGTTFYLTRSSLAGGSLINTFTIYDAQRNGNKLGTFGVGNSSTTITYKDVEYEFQAYTMSKQITVTKHKTATESLSGLTNPLTEVTLKTGQTVYIDRTVSNGALVFRVFTSNNASGTPVATISATTANATQTATIGGTTYTFKRTSTTSLDITYPAITISDSTIGLVPTLKELTLEGKTFYVERAEQGKKFNIYASNDTTVAPIASLASNAAGTTTYTEGDVTYTFTRTSDTSLSVSVPAKKEKTATGISAATVHSVTTQTGQTFYVTRTGTGTNQKFNIFTSEDAATPAATLSASTTNASTKLTVNGIEYTFKRDSNSQITITYPETELSYSLKTTTIGTAMDGAKPTDNIKASSNTLNGQTGIIAASQMLMVPDGNGGRKLYHDYSTGDTFLNYSEARGGTYSQAGLQVAQNMLMAATGTSNRQAAIVWLTDGYPTHGDDDYMDVELDPSGSSHMPPLGSGSTCTNQIALRTIQTAIYTKQQVSTKYANTVFYTIGTGVTDQVTKTIIDPSDANYATCKNSGTSTSYSSSSSASARTLYNILEKELTTEQKANRAYCDWSISGNITESELNEAFNHIVEEIHTTVMVERYLDIISSDYVTFNDTIGDSMNVQAAPVLIYNNKKYVATSSSVSGTTTTYTYAYTVTDTARNMQVDLSKVKVQVTDPKTGRTTVRWDIPSNYVPEIIENAVNSPSTFTDAEPIRLVYQVGLDTDDPDANTTYYVTPADVPATVTFTINSKNPYYYNQKAIVPTVNYKDVTRQKTRNVTATKPYSTTESVASTGVMTMSLGNNGLLRVSDKPINPDVVVIDYGLPVNVNVIANDTLDGLNGTLNGIATAVANDTILETETYSTSKLSGTVVTTAGQTLNGVYGTFSYNNKGEITYTPNTMSMKHADVIYYEFKTKQGSNTVYMYTTCSIVPATSIFYEDDFITFKGNWQTEDGLSKTQASDRPGSYEIAEELDANNVYGYDDANLESTTYSLGSVHYVEVKSGDTSWPTATFTFTGNAFDVISTTSNNTGLMLCKVYKGTEATGTPVVNWIVDTYYGFTRTQDGYIKHEWHYADDNQWHVSNTIVTNTSVVPESQKLPSNPAAIDTTKTYVTYEKNYTWTPVDANSDNALYQIPVLSSPEMEYGTYTVEISVAYSSFFDHHFTTDALTGKKTYGGKYSFYLDAVRIYEPAENYNDYNDYYYVLDNEGWPQYINVKESLISAAESTSADKINGVCFIDSVASNSSLEDLKLYGPNNELYLAPGQSVAFALSSQGDGTTVNKVQVGAKWLNGDSAEATFTLGTGTSAVKEVHSIGSTTEMYYSVNSGVIWNNGESELITITNSSTDAYISLCNIKVTYNSAPVMKMTAFYTPDLMAAAKVASAKVYMSSISTCIHRYDATEYAPTYDSVGLREYTCKDCGHTYTEVIPALERPVEQDVEKVDGEKSEDKTDDVEKTDDIQAKEKANDEKAVGADESNGEKSSLSEEDREAINEILNENDIDYEISVEEAANGSWFANLFKAIGEFFSDVWEAIASFFGGLFE